MPTLLEQANPYSPLPQEQKAQIRIFFFFFFPVSVEADQGKTKNKMPLKTLAKVSVVEGKGVLKPEICKPRF